MVYYKATMQHSEASFQSLAHMQYDLFCKGNLYGRSALSFALLIVLIVDFVRDVFKKELTAVSFFRYVFLGTAVFPGVIVLFYQMTMLYGGEEAANNGMALVFLTSQYFSQGLFNTIIGIARDIAFPMLVVIYGYKYFSRKEKFVLLYFVVTLIQCIVLEETGLRADHGNFFWGMYNAGYLLFLYMVPKFIQLVKMTPWKQKNLWNRFLTVAGSGMLCMHLFFGLKYFWMLFNGKYFYI